MRGAWRARRHAASALTPATFSSASSSAHQNLQQNCPTTHCVCTDFLLGLHQNLVYIKISDFHQSYKHD